jgi:hypothetical protein
VIFVLHPVGPLPASVYWRRRGLVLAGVVLALVLLVSLLGGGGGGGVPVTVAAGGADGGGEPEVGASTPSGSPAQPTASGSLTGTPAPLDETGPGEDAGGGGSGGSGPAAATAGRSSASPLGPPRPCADAALRLTVTAGQSVYQVGDMPVIELAVQNTSTATCTRDLGAARQEVLLYAGTARIWSSNDCYPDGERDVQALLPHERATFSVKWSGLSSTPGCASTRSRVGPGRYRLLGRLGTLQSSPATLTLAEAGSG